MFNYEDAIQSKYYFDRLRQEKGLWFDWHYNILEAVIKNAYVVQQVQQAQQVYQKSQPMTVLDLGCGNGHICRSLSKIIEGSFVGFDTNINLYTKVYNLRFMISSLRAMRQVKIKFYRLSHIDFFKKFYGKKFDVIIDNCSVTHFDTRSKGYVNSGWDFMARILPKYLHENGVFICATDVGTDSISNSEFCTQENLTNIFNNKGWNLNNIDLIQKSIPSNSPLLSMFSKLSNETYLRLPPPNILQDGLLGVTGFTAKIL
jgi:SAM-dependent methyltransferase